MLCRLLVLSLRWLVVACCVVTLLSYAALLSSHCAGWLLLLALPLLPYPLALPGVVFAVNITVILVVFAVVLIFMTPVRIVLEYIISLIPLNDSCLMQSPFNRRGVTII